MKKILFIIIMSIGNFILRGQSNCCDSKNILLYKKSFEYIDSLKVYGDIKINLSDTIFPFELSNFTEELSTEYNLIQLDSIDKKNEFNRCNFRHLNKKLNANKKSNQILFFSKIFDENYLIAQLIGSENSKISYNYDKVASFTEGIIFLFKFDKKKNILFCKRKKIFFN